MVNNIYTFIMWIAVALAVGLITYAGIQMIVNSANPGKSLAARGLIIQTLIALAIVFGSSLIVNETLKALAGKNADSEGVFRNFKCTSTSPNLGGKGSERVVRGAVKLDNPGQNTGGGATNGGNNGGSGTPATTINKADFEILYDAKPKAQTNNGWCGKASVASALSAYGVNINDSDVPGFYLQATLNAKQNKAYYELVDVKVGSQPFFKNLDEGLQTGPVVIFTGLYKESNGMGHIMTVVGKRKDGSYLLNDSYKGGVKQMYWTQNQFVSGYFKGDGMFKPRKR